MNSGPYANGCGPEPVNGNGFHENTYSRGSASLKRVLIYTILC